MRLHVYRHPDGAFELVSDDALSCAPVSGARDLGVAEIDLAAFSSPLVLAMGLHARATARGSDSAVVERALALRDVPTTESAQS